MRFLILAKELDLIKCLKDCLTPEYILDIETEMSCGIYASQSEIYSLIIIDNDLSSISGSRVCKQIREKDVKIPILMLNKNGGALKRVSCLERGADDCLKRPFNSKELKARIKVLLRRFSKEVPKTNIYKLKDVSVDLWNRVLIVGDRKVSIKRKEFDLLELFILNRLRALSRDRIFAAIWKDESVQDSNVVAVYVCYLRKTLQELTGMNLIKTVYGLGYVFDDSSLQKNP